MYRQLPTGDLFVPRRGNTPPACPDGYIRDAGDQWIFHIDLKPCLHRQERPDLTCQCKKIYLWCEKTGNKIKQLNCKECQDGVQKGTV